MSTYLLRLVLPDRPGALGAVASRVGALRGDVISIEVLDRSSGIALDQLLVDLPSGDILPLLASELAEVDGVAVERIAPVEAASDHRLDAYDTAVAMMTQSTWEGVLSTLAERARHELDAGWAAVVDTESRLVTAATGDAPLGPWLAAYVVGTRAGPGSGSEAGAGAGAGSGVGAAAGTRAGGCRDIAWADLPAWDLVLACGRPGWPFDPHELRRLHAIGSLADARWVDLSSRQGRSNHPSAPRPSCAAAAGVSGVAPESGPPR